VTLQYVDPLVSRTKFDRELAEFQALSDSYRQRGWFLAHVDFPRVFVALAAPQVTPAVLVMGVDFDYTNYDAAPPSVRLVNPFTRVPYKFSELPTQLLRGMPAQEVQLPGMPPGAKMALAVQQPYMQAYGPEDIPFLCVAGVREYHDHPAHSGDVWELHRPTGAGRLVRLLEIIHRYGVAPIVGLGVQLVPQVQLNYGPPPQ
jgi:hypothetical protein